MTASLRSSPPTRTPTTGISDSLPITQPYYYATLSSFTLYYQPPLQGVVAVGGIHTTTFSSNSWTSFQGLISPKGSSSRSQQAYLTVTSIGLWTQVLVTSTPLAELQPYDAVLSSSTTYSVDMSLLDAVNLSQPDVFSVTTSSAGAQATAPSFGTHSRFITDTSLWLEFEAPMQVGTLSSLNSPWKFMQSCSRNSTASLNFVPIPQGNVAESVPGSLQPANFMLAQISGLPSGSFCSFQVKLLFLFVILL